MKRRTFSLGRFICLSAFIFFFLGENLSLHAQSLVGKAYGEMWIRLVHPTQPKLVLESMPSPLKAPIMSKRNYEAEAQLWCLAGEKGRYKLYNRQMGGSYALTLTREGKQVTGLALVPAAHATLWELKSTTDDKGVTHTQLTAFPSKKEKICLGRGEKEKEASKIATPEDAAAQWVVEDASRQIDLTVTVSDSILPLELQDYVAEISLTGTSSGTLSLLPFEKAIRRQQLGRPITVYFPLQTAVNAVCTSPCRGYAFESWTKGDQVSEDSIKITLEAQTPKATGATAVTPLRLTLSTQPAENAVSVFRTYDSYGVPYRIPTLSVTRRGELLAINDRRYCFSDIGYGRVDIVMKSSWDGGKTWGKDTVILRGGGKGVQTGYGDPCVVADRTSDKALVVCVAGDIPYGSSTLEHPQHIVRIEGEFDPKSQSWKWGAPTDMTSRFYKELLCEKVNGLFMSSGRIMQSRKIKVDKYYRLYAALCTHKGNFVVYSDDFGKEWKVLGGADSSCVPKGDEAKCEELPDGSVLISSRKSGGRWWNIYHFDNLFTAKGHWDKPIDSRTVQGGIKNSSGPCNGEILMVSVLDKESNKTVPLLLQSLPEGPGRHNVAIYYKKLAAKADYNSTEHLASQWEGPFIVSPRGSAYSTMDELPDGRIGFYFEEEPEYFQMIYQPLSIEVITKGKYATLPAKTKKKNAR